MNMDYDAACGHDAYSCGHDACAEEMCGMCDMQMPAMNGMQGMYMDPCACMCMPEELCPALPLAEAYVRPQSFGRTFSPAEALCHGTLFPDLVSQYK